ncbi:hypothetical protein O0L34_g10383 [Tuta absoluta]|nr:hypothetical protein O0L34_g10383 [Tuta absoluta]
MRRVSPNNPVRRRLFPAEDSEDAKNDNFVNLFKESIETDLAQKREKWNFDFKTETPLEGDIQWFRNEPDVWIGVKPGEDEETEHDDKPEDPLLQMKNENEVTPKSNTEHNVPLLRKRRSDADGLNLNATVKRKISFD